jgi:hypothetical protein
MRIAGVNEFLSRFITRPDHLTVNNPVKPFVSIPGRDSIDISELGMRLSFRTNKAPLINPKANTGSDPILSMMDKSMSEVESILEQMKDLASIAADPNTSTADRLKLQIKMEELREQLAEAPNAMSWRLLEMSGYTKDVHPERPRILELGVYNPPADNPSMLQRALGRALKGEAWDVAETYEESLELRMVRVGDREIKISKGEWFDLPPNIDPERDNILLFPEVTGGRWHVTDDKDLPTVRQRLEASGTIILMDTKSAQEGVERIEKELNAIREVRKELAAFKEQYAQDPSKRIMNDVVINDDGAEGGRMKLRTMLGVMEREIDRDTGREKLSLSQPNGPKGEMFAKIERLFTKAAINLSGSRISEGVPADKVTRTWTNRSESWVSEKAG